jgi:hypothetical protein
MSLFVRGRLISIITYDDDEPMTKYPEFLEACSRYDMIYFKDNKYEHSIL